MSRIPIDLYHTGSCAGGRAHGADLLLNAHGQDSHDTDHDTGKEALQPRFSDLVVVDHHRFFHVGHLNSALSRNSPGWGVFRHTIERHLSYKSGSNWSITPLLGWLAHANTAWLGPESRHHPPPLAGRRGSRLG